MSRKSEQDVKPQITQTAQIDFFILVIIIFNFQLSVIQLELNGDASGERLGTRSLGTIGDNTHRPVTHLRIGTRVLGETEQVVARDIERKLRETPLLDDFRIERIADLRVVQTDERAIFDEAV